jgi:hypothetical protein
MREAALPAGSAFVRDIIGTAFAFFQCDHGILEPSFSSATGKVVASETILVVFADAELETKD